MSSGRGAWGKRQEGGPRRAQRNSRLGLESGHCHGQGHGWSMPRTELQATPTAGRFCQDTTQHSAWHASRSGFGGRRDE